MILIHLLDFFKKNISVKECRVGHHQSIKHSNRGSETRLQKTNLPVNDNHFHFFCKFIISLSQDPIPTRYGTSWWFINSKSSSSYKSVFWSYKQQVSEQFGGASMIGEHEVGGHSLDFLFFVFNLQNTLMSMRCAVLLTFYWPR